jgi:hypothetical protein
LIRWLFSTVSVSMLWDILAVADDRVGEGAADHVLDAADGVGARRPRRSWPPG